MKKQTSRFAILALAMMIMMVALIVKLGTLTLAEGNELSTQAQSRMMRTTVLKGTRGRILDKNGVVLAYDEKCYNVEFLRDAARRTDYDSAIYTESLLKAIEIIENCGGTVINTSYIQMDDDGKLVYDWGVDNEKSKSTRYYDFCSAMGFYVTDEIAKDPTKWKTPESAYLDMCKSWHIPADLPFEDAVKVISVRQDVNLNNYRAYEPVTIAYNVNMDVVAEIEMHKSELPGINVAESTTRIYPFGSTAAHIIGYLQKNATEDMVEKQGYSYTDYIGVSGVEATMESVLSGSTTEHHGSRVIMVDRNGSEISEVSVEPATDGNDVMLTIDLDLQVVVEKALEKIIGKISTKEQGLIDEDNAKEAGYKYSYLNSDGERVPKDINTAETGAIVVLDANNGDVLSLASYPSYDPNWFIKGLTDDQANYLLGDDAKDTTPLRNKAVSARYAPGSIFKMATGLAGLMENKIGLNETVDDEGYYILYDSNGNPILNNAPKCWTNYPDNHSNQDIVQAIKNACNYYFCEVANRLGIDLLNKWGDRLGLTTNTNIETTGEVCGILGGQDTWYDNRLSLDEQKTFMPRYIFNNICTMLVKYVKSYMPGSELDENDQSIKDCSNALLKLQDGDVSGKGPDVRKIINDYLGIPEGIISRQTWVSEILSQLVELQWKDSQTIRTGFGQGSTLVTPIAIARYVAAIANKGTVYDVHLVDRILDTQGNTVDEVKATVYDKIDAPDEYWTAIKSGLRGVVSPEDHGTAATAFSSDFRYLDRISGKTGTAQIGTTVQIDIENTSWFVVFTPIENPEIVIVVCIPYGFSGTSSAGAIEDIVTYYYSRKEASAPENLVDTNGVTP